MRQCYLKFLRLCVRLGQLVGIPSDLVAHFLVMFMYGCVFALLLPWNWHIVIASVIIVLKEVYDCMKPNSTGFSLSDIAYGYIGFVLGMSLAEVFRV